MDNRQPKKILVVEDDQSLREVLQTMLANKGFDVLTAGDGEEGLTVALRNKPDLILLNIKMPKMDGITMLKKLREDPWGKGAAVLVLTNDSNPEHVSDALKNNALDYLVKSDWKIDEVVERVKTLFGTYSYA